MSIQFELEGLYSVLSPRASILALASLKAQVCILDERSIGRQICGTSMLQTYLVSGL